MLCIDSSYHARSQQEVQQERTIQYLINSRVWSPNWRFRSLFRPSDWIGRRSYPRECLVRSPLRISSSQETKSTEASIGSLGTHTIVVPSRVRPRGHRSSSLRCRYNPNKPQRERHGRGKANPRTTRTPAERKQKAPPSFQPYEITTSFKDKRVDLSTLRKVLNG